MEEARRNMTTPAPDEERPRPVAGPSLSLEERKLALEARKLALDESFPRKWGPTLSGFAGTILVALITTAGTFILSNGQEKGRREAAQREIQETQRTEIREEARRRTENARAALTLYFDHLADMNPDSNPQALDHMKLVSAVADAPSVQAIFDQMFRRAIEARQRAMRSAAGGVAPSTVAEGLPDLVEKAPGERYQAQDFLAYIQHPPGRRDAAEALAERLRSLGLRTPGLEEVRASPSASQVRYYKPAHRGLAASVASQLGGAPGGPWVATGLANGERLPDGVMEFWIGSGAEGR